MNAAAHEVRFEKADGNALAHGILNSFWHHGTTKR
jgi:hypothetical protein